MKVNLNNVIYRDVDGFNMAKQEAINLWLKADKDNLTKEEAKLGSLIFGAMNTPSGFDIEIMKAVSNYYTKRVLVSKANPATEEQISAILGKCAIWGTGEYMVNVRDVKLIEHNGEYYGTNMRGKLVSQYIPTGFGLCRSKINALPHQPKDTEIAQHVKLMSDPSDTTTGIDVMCMYKNLRTV